MEKTRFEIDDNAERRYMHGLINRCIRHYYYLQEGMQQLNGLRTIGYALIGLAGVLAVAKSGNYWILAVIGLAAIPVLDLLGWLWVTRGKKSTEYYQMRYTTTYGKYGFELQEEILSTLKRIEEKLK